MAGRKKTTAAAENKDLVKETAPKAAEKAAEKAAPKTAAKTTKTTKTTSKAKAPVAADPVVIIEYADTQVDVETIINDCKAHYKSLGHNTPKKLAVYVKPEEKVAYYTVNGKGSDEYKVNF